MYHSVSLGVVRITASVMNELACTGTELCQIYYVPGKRNEMGPFTVVTAVAFGCALVYQYQR